MKIKCFKCGRESNLKPKNFPVQVSEQNKEDPSKSKVVGYICKKCVQKGVKRGEMKFSKIERRHHAKRPKRWFGIS